MPDTPNVTLAEMRDHAWSSARTASDPLIARQFFELAQCYDAALLELHETGITIVPSHDSATISWRSVPLWTSNDQ